MDVRPRGVVHNLDRMTEYVAQAAATGADVVAFPELCDTDYSDADLTGLETPIPGDRTQRLADAARKHHIAVVAGLLESVPQGRYNTAVMLGAMGGIEALYHKAHLSCDTRGETITAETDAFLAGDDLPVFDTSLGRVGIMICKDGDYPEVMRTLSVKGARIVFWITNRASVSSAAYHLAESNRVALIVSNRAAGHAAGGGSAIFNCLGQPLAQAKSDETLLTAELDLDAMEHEHDYHWNIGRIRKPELYKPIAEISGEY
jgi:predicted amidohydrolase